MTAVDESPAWSPWSFGGTSGWTGDVDLVGFDVEAVDGHVGKIDEAAGEVGRSYLVVHAGRWALGSRLMLPAGTVVRVDRRSRRVYVDRTKKQIKSSPPFDAAMYRQQEYRDLLDRHYRR